MNRGQHRDQMTGRFAKVDPEKDLAPVKLTGMSFPDDRPEVWGKPAERQPDQYAPVSTRLRAGRSWT